MIGRGIRRGLGRAEGEGRCWGWEGGVWGRGGGLDMGCREEVVVMAVLDCGHD